MATNGEILDQLRDLNLRVSEIDRKLFKGNGDSLVTQVQLNRVRIIDMEKHSGKRSGRLHEAALIGVGFLLTTFGAIMMAMVEHFLGV